MHQTLLKLLSLFCFICLYSFHITSTYLPELSPYLFSIHPNFKTLETFIYSRHSS